MVLTTILFYVYAAILIGAALGVVLARNPVRSALFLVLAFFTSAVLWLLLEAEFLGIVLVLVYVGAVMVLFLFVVMMLDINVAELRAGFTRYAPLGAVVAALMVAEIAYVVWVRHLGFDLGGGAPPLPAGYSNTKSLGAVLYTDYALPFQLAAVVLLIAIVAAIALTMRHRTGYKQQDVAGQVAVRKADRIRIVQVEPEKRP
ncbi:MAG: NADH-quinone oxidoreductase subunit J [Proteobacteria bacterium]|nr:NADH-quinone oxidoreductase subunit J [Pseudomonadota bacterium]